MTTRSFTLSPRRGASVRIALAALLVPALALTAQSARAGEAWPSHPLKMVVPFPAGSSPDLIARVVGEPLGKVLRQPVVIDNRPGAGGNIGTEAVAKAAPNGYTLLFTINGPLVTAPLLYKKLGYDPVKDLAPVTLVATSPNVLVVDPALKVDSVKAFVELARAKPGVLNYGSVGAGSASHLAMEILKARAGLNLVHVPYNGFPAITTAILGGQVQASFMVPAIAMAQVRAGKIRALAVTSSGRSAALPDMPTMGEAGQPGFEVISWQAILAPARTPAALVHRLSAELVTIIRGDEARGKMLAQFFTAAGTAPEGLTNLMKAERASSEKLIRALKIQPE